MIFFPFSSGVVLASDVSGGERGMFWAILGESSQKGPKALDAIARW
jgi:hypothetical protein